MALSLLVISASSRVAMGAVAFGHVGQGAPARHGLGVGTVDHILIELLCGSITVCQMAALPARPAT